MSDNARMAMLIAAKAEQDAARAGFIRLSGVLVAIRRMTAGSDDEVAALANFGIEVATEFADEARAASDEYARLMLQEGGSRD